MQIKDRIKELRRVRASELRPNPRNWRTHPAGQADALRGLLAEVGYADALIAREVDGGLELLDGHLRAETTPDSEVPVLVLDVDEREAGLILATLDPLAAMAEANAGRLEALLELVETESEAVRAMLDRLRKGDNDVEQEWLGMPEFKHEDKTAFQSIHIHLVDQAAVDNFAELLHQTITPKTRALWYPKAAIETYADKQYINDTA